MIAYPRWKIVLVAVVLVIGIFLALPNLFGEERCAAAGARPGRGASTPTAPRSSSCSRTRASRRAASFLDQGRLTLRFASKQDQLKARDVIAEARPDQFTIALSQASRVPEWMRNLGLSPLKLGLDLARRRVPGVSGRRAGRGEAAARPPRAGFPRLAAQRARAVSGRAGGLPVESRARAVPRRRQLRQGQGGHPRGQPQPELDRCRRWTARPPWSWC